MGPRGSSSATPPQCRNLNTQSPFQSEAVYRTLLSSANVLAVLLFLSNPLNWRCKGDWPIIKESQTRKSLELHCRPPLRPPPARTKLHLLPCGRSPVLPPCGSSSTATGEITRGASSFQEPVADSDKEDLGYIAAHRPQDQGPPLTPWGFPAFLLLCCLLEGCNPRPSPFSLGSWCSTVDSRTGYQ